MVLLAWMQQVLAAPYGRHSVYYLAAQGGICFHGLEPELDAVQNRLESYW